MAEDAKALDEERFVIYDLGDWLRDWECEPSADPVLAVHEAGHVVVRAALGAPAEWSHICTFTPRRPEGLVEGFRPGTVGPGTGGFYGPPEVEAVCIAAGATAEGVWAGESIDWWHEHKYGYVDLQALYDLGDRMAAGPRSNWKTDAHLAARSIILSNMAALEAVVDVLLLEQWVSGEVLDVVTAEVPNVWRPQINWGVTAAGRRNRDLAFSRARSALWPY